MYCSVLCSSLLFIGLANKDPDVDAIFRLTRKLNITFANSEPVNIPIGIMTPYNSQNTVRSFLSIHSFFPSFIHSSSRSLLSFLHPIF